MNRHTIQLLSVHQFHQNEIRVINRFFRDICPLIKIIVKFVENLRNKIWLKDLQKNKKVK